MIRREDMDLFGGVQRVVVFIIGTPSEATEAAKLAADIPPMQPVAIMTIEVFDQITYADDIATGASCVCGWET